jgi:hypothetical protein
MLPILTSGFIVVLARGVGGLISPEAGREPSMTPPSPFIKN